jgi:serine/threonine-protein kinase
VALKILAPEREGDSAFAERFNREARVLARLNHPGIATLFSFFRQGDEFFMVMEFVPGRTLEGLLRDFGPMPVEQAAPVFAKILAGIEHAHQLGILHRDIKPANIFVTKRGHAKILDFGLAKLVPERHAEATGWWRSRIHCPRAWGSRSQECIGLLPF